MYELYLRIKIFLFLFLCFSKSFITTRKIVHSGWFIINSLKAKITLIIKYGGTYYLVGIDKENYGFSKTCPDNNFIKNKSTSTMLSM